MPWHRADQRDCSSSRSSELGGLRELEVVVSVSSLTGNGPVTSVKAAAQLVLAGGVLGCVRKT